MSPSTLTTASQIIATAFTNYKLIQYAFHGKTEQERSLLVYHLYKRCVKAASIYGGVITTPDNQGAVIWLPGNNFRLSLMQEVASGMAAIPFQIGLKPTWRLTQHDGESEGWIKQNAGPNMGYLWCIGVLPQARGKGHSRLLVDQCMQQMAQQGLTTCWLKTEDPVNVDIYKKLGFTLMNQMQVKSSNITSWAFMKHIAI